jgi:hypothetical protein
VPSAYGVGATNSSDVIASFSSRGPVTWNSPPYVGTWIKPDISAPGVAIFSAIPGNDWEGDWNGTSMAAPHVSGTVALMRQANPSLTVDQIKQLIAQTSLDLGTAGMDNTYGWGRINAFAAVTAALAGVGTLDGVISSSGGGFVESARVRVVETGQQVLTDANGHYTPGGRRHLHHQVTALVINGERELACRRRTTTLGLTCSGTVGAIAGAVTDDERRPASQPASTSCFGRVVPRRPPILRPAHTASRCRSVYDLTFNRYPTRHEPQRHHRGESAMTTLNVELDPAKSSGVDDDKGKGYEVYCQPRLSRRSFLHHGHGSPTAEQMQRPGDVADR